MAAAGYGERLSATDAAFAGLQVLRRRPGAYLVWLGVMLALSLLIAGAMVGLIGPQLAAMQAGALADPAASLRLFGTVAPFYGLFILLATSSTASSTRR